MESQNKLYIKYKTDKEEEEEEKRKKRKIREGEFNVF
jgi:hypothetical protein